MKILVVSQCFFPDDFRINDIVDALVREGHTVLVLTGLPDYATSKVPKEYRFFKKRRESWQGVRIVRMPTVSRRSGVLFRSLNYFSFAFWGSMYARFCRFKADVVFSYETSPILQAIPAVTYKKHAGVPLVLYCLDLWPESLKAWHINESHPLFRFIKRLSRRIYGSCDMIAVTSKPFRGYLREVNDIADERIVYLPQHAKDLYSDICGRYEENGCVDFLFAGNVGAVQNVDCIIRAAAAIQTIKPFRVHIVGSGSEYDACIKLANECGADERVVFHGKYPLSEMKRFYQMADCFLLTLRGGDFVGLTLPAKTQGYLCAGKPVAAAIDGAAAELIRDADCGECVAAGDYQGLAEAMTKIIDDFELYKEKGMNGRRYYENNFTGEIFMRSLNGLLNHAVKAEGSDKALKVTYQFTKRQILFTLLTILCVALIFANSLQNGTNSSRESGFALKLIENLFHSLGISTAVSEHVIRKLAHFTEYTILGVLLGLTVRSYTQRVMNHIFVPLFIGLAVPVTDEYIQSFVDGRGSMVQDVILDFAGVLFGLTVAVLCILRIERHKLSQNNQGKRK